MKKIIFLKVIFFITINCSSDKESLASAQEKGLDLNGLKLQKEEMINQINILKKKLKDIDEEKKGPTSVTNNAMFVGSTAELQKMLKEMNKKSK